MQILLGLEEVEGRHKDHDYFYRFDGREARLQWRRRVDEREHARRTIQKPKPQAGRQELKLPPIAQHLRPDQGERNELRPEKVITACGPAIKY